MMQACTSKVAEADQAKAEYRGRINVQGAVH